MTEDPSTLAVFYKGWSDYQTLLTKAIAPLTTEQLTLSVAPGLRSISTIVRHMIGGRARWFHDMIGVGDEEFASLGRWDSKGAPERDAAELVFGLETSWRVMQEALASWTPEEMLQSYENDPGDEPALFTRQWIIWHLIEHDLHHGGEVSLTLGLHGLQALDL
ncbi:DinB family protein [Tengunoibacter tsumagoiensis]|nr:DinB family protein [Tengunoibacter tsumagoiensis]